MNTSQTLWGSCTKAKAVCCRSKTLNSWRHCLSHRTEHLAITSPVKCMSLQSFPPMPRKEHFPCGSQQKSCEWYKHSLFLLKDVHDWCWHSYHTPFLLYTWAICLTRRNLFFLSWFCHITLNKGFSRMIFSCLVLVCIVTRYLSHCSMAGKRPHDQGNSYEKKHFVGSLLTDSEV